jgi:hypothetical protein
MQGGFGGSKPPEPPKPPAPPSKAQAADSVEGGKKKPRGFSSTILTGTSTSSDAASTITKSLLGQ